MDASDNWLLCNKLRKLVAEAADNPDAAEPVWSQIERVIEKADADEVLELMVPVLDRSLEDVHAVLDGWDAGTVPMVEWDKAILKRAMKAYRKRLKLARLDDESSGSRNPLSKGEESSILGVRAPEQYTPDIWERLVQQGRLRDGGHGLLELASD